MESSKPEPKPDPKSEKGKSPAEDRVKALTGKPEAGKPEPGQASQRLREQKRAEEKTGKPVLTEKQRIAARRKRREQKKRRVPVSGNVLSRGLRASVNEVRRTFVFIGRAFLGGLDRIKPLGGIIVSLFAGLLQALGRAGAAIATFAASALRTVGRVMLSLDRVVTARRALIVVAFAAGALLIVSQFLDFKAIEIGQAGYAQVQEITRAPRQEAQTPLDHHSLVLLLAGAVAVLTAVAAALTRKRIIGLVLVLTGGLALGVALLVDLPGALDTADAELAFAGAKGVILSGFWLEIGAGAVLIVAGAGLVLGAPAPKRAERGPVPRRQRHTVNSPASGSRA